MNTSKTNDSNQSEQNTKTFEEILQEQDYKYKGEHELSKLNSSCIEYLSEAGALWYADFNKGIYPILKKLFEDKKILAHSFVEEPRWFKRPDTTEEEKIQYKEKQKQKLERKLKYKGILALEKLKVEHPDSFKIGNIYSVLREYYHLNKDDKLEFAPLNLVNPDNFNSIKKKAIELYDKRICMKERWSNSNLKKSISEINLEETYRYDIPVHIPKHCEIDRWSRNVDVCALLGNIYLKLANKIPIAYQNEEAAVKFFEKETGINLSSPKINKIYSF